MPPHLPLAPDTSSSSRGPAFSAFKFATLASIANCINITWHIMSEHTASSWGSLTDMYVLSSANGKQLLPTGPFAFSNLNLLGQINVTALV